MSINQTTSGCNAKGEIKVTMTEMPTVNLTVSDTLICDGGQITLVATPATAIPAALGNVTYTWYDNGQLIEGVTDSIYIVSPVVYDNDNTAHNYTVMATAEAPACQSAISNVAKVMVTANPVIIISSEYDTYCVNTEFNIAVKITGNYRTTDDIQLYVDNGTSFASHTTPFQTSASSWQIQYTDKWTSSREGNAYNYQFVVTSANGCSARSNELPINIMDPQNVYVSVAEDTICFGGTCEDGLQFCGNGLRP